MKAFFPLVIFMLFSPRQKMPPIKFHSFLTLLHQPNKTQNFLSSPLPSIISSHVFTNQTNPTKLKLLTLN